MNIENRKILVLGGYGLVGMAVCRELLARGPREIQIHSLRLEESEKAREELAAEAGATVLSVSAGNIFGLVEGPARKATRRASAPSSRRLGRRRPSPPSASTSVLAESRPDVVIDCVNTATGIAYRDIFRAAEEVLQRSCEDGGHPGGRRSSTCSKPSTCRA